MSVPLLIWGCEMLDLGRDGRRIDVNTTFGEEFSEIRVGQAVVQGAADSQRDDVIEKPVVARGEARREASSTSRTTVEGDP